MKHFVIIGNSAAGLAAVEAIRKTDSESRITVLSDEEYPAYCRCLISYYLAQDVKEPKLIYRSPDFYQNNNVELILNKKVERLDSRKSRIICQDKTVFNYDSLLIATGAHPKFPQMQGIKKRGVFGFHTIKDAKDIDALIPVTKTACVLGGGVIGLKAAYALKKRNIEVKVIVKSPQVLSKMLDAESAAIVKNKLEEHGIEILLRHDVTEIIGNGDVKAAKLDSGKVIGCSLVIVDEGVVPNIELVKDAAIKIQEGITTNDLLQTDIPTIYAAGDVCESFDIALSQMAVNAFWPIAIEQGKIAGANMAGELKRYAGSVGMNAIEFFGLPIVSLGVYKVSDEERSKYCELKLIDTKANLYKKLILKDGVLKGAILIGDIKNSGVLLRLVREKLNVASLKDELLQENFSYPNIINLVSEKERLYV